uniref:(northern house mosquito) hypothetical protein n=1 Tax=Culex pipiens TaxID=7175 RepID=A0A8D8DFV7_CULPI
MPSKSRNKTITDGLAFLDVGQPSVCPDAVASFASEDFCALPEIPGMGLDEVDSMVSTSDQPESWLSVSRISHMSVCFHSKKCRSLFWYLQKASTPTVLRADM